MIPERHFYPGALPSKDVSRSEQKTNFLARIDSAWDLSSVGMGVMLHAVDHFANRRKLPDWASDAISYYGSNYLDNPYISDRMIAETSRPAAFSPYSDRHIRLLRATREQYDGLERMQMRLVLGGDLSQVPDPRAPISEEEYRSLLFTAWNRGSLRQYEKSLLLELEYADSAWSLVRSFCRKGVADPIKLMTYWNRIRLQDFREETLQAAIRKLGCMLAVTDQLTFEANALGVAVPATYKPTRHIEEWEANWQEMFDEPMPTIDELYRQAHVVVAGNTDPQDPLVAYLHPLSTLPQLAA